MYLLFIFNCTLTSFKFFFCVKTHIIYLIDFILIKTRFNILICSIIRIYFLVFLKEDFIHCTVSNIIITLLPVIFLSWYRIVPTVLRGLILTYLEPKSPRTLHSYDECPGICMRQVFDSPFRWSTYIFLRLPVLSLIA